MERNTANGGLVLKAGGKLYISESTGAFGTVITDLTVAAAGAGGGRTLQADGWFWFMNEDGRHLYYSDQRRGGALYRSGTDSHEPELLLDVPCMNLTLSGGGIYYIDENDGKLYRCGKDGCGTEPLTEERVLGYVIRSDETLYYATAQGIRACIPGSRYEERLTGTPAAGMISAGDRLVYADKERRYALTVLDIQSGAVGAVYDDLSPNSLNTDGRYLYCANRRNDSTIYRVDPEQGRIIRIFGESADHLHVIGDELFFRGQDGWFAMSLYGGQASKVAPNGRAGQ
ncbi:DUF5050 domain-containing protein [Paenibacillus sp. KQZ6P-2]|uniref:DUF5050 domain-containing protein n=1 Tax=Paenibacillus mangrovi TaxID=2931978 RepID=A0A9X2B208_9BACL|nr:DUF5050 domain-containing protein [Paenibacillus mangrovi]MCJ8011821.1 DUF5050 domain-containing protein [Paenibacillus mangrovi]